NLGEFAWSIENLLNRVIDGTVATSPDVLGVLDEAGKVLPTLVEESRDIGAAGSDVSELSGRAFALAGLTPPAAAPTPIATPEPASEPVIAEETAESPIVDAVVEPPPADQPIPLQLDEVDEPSPESTTEPLELEPLSIDAYREPGDESLLLDSVMQAPVKATPPAGDQPVAHGPDESILTAVEVQDSEFAEHDGMSSGSGDTSLNAVFLNEAKGHLDVLDDFVRKCADVPGGCLMEAGVRRAMHTLCGSARTAGVASIAELAGSLETFTETLQNLQRVTDGRALDLLNRAHRTLAQLAAAVDEGHPEPAGWASLRDEVLHETEGLSEVQPEIGSDVDDDDAPDPELLEVFLDEAKELLETLEAEMAAWEAANDDQSVARLQRNLHTMKGGARLAGVGGVGDLSHALESVFESVVERRIASEPKLKQLVRHATDTLAQDIEYLVSGQLPGGHPLMVDRLEAAAHGREWDEVGVDETALDAESAFAASSLMGGEAEPMAVDDTVVAFPAPVDEPAEAEAEDVEPAPIDEPELVAEAVSDQLDEDEDEEQGASASIQQVEAETEAEQSIETEQAAQFDTEPLSANSESLVTFDADESFQADDIDDLHDSALLTDSQLMTDSELLEDSSFLVIGSPAGGPGAGEGTVVQFPGGEALAEEDGFVPRKPLPDEVTEPSTGGERVRVASDVLDQMVNNAGEVSIYRARIEQQNSSFAFNLGELQQTIDRLRGQLRNLELETEAQILSRHERDTDSRADFDPLELDRYSTIQQLSRALSETVEDLSNLGRSLNDLSRDTDTLLLQQARVTTDLQDGLLRTRMVRFGSRVARLERVVRQTAHSVAKRASLKVEGGDQDMDRAILERMMGPLEHLLRNAVSHGIEDPDTRVAKGKNAVGSITLQLAREGTDVLLSLADDGAGLDRQRIRDKAIDRGMLDADADIGDDELYQLILQPGFSTAEELSQVSGRGVGMDVVLSEVKQLGGALEIASDAGHGTRFTIRLPFTLAITDALLVKVGEDFYAVPHSTMDGVARIAVDDLRAIYAGQQDVYNYGGRDYTVRYLGSTLGSAAANIAEGVRWVPMLLVRSGEHRIAFQVDGLLGNRQIVVKSIGVQLSGVRWFTGGTILADGQIALILDVNALVRMDVTNVPVQRMESSQPLTKGVSVMVVDDSITVRKVTSRLLERHNMQVVTAKDGVDAVTVLQEHHPDVMLLDIEMPRMDGYELARHMRSTPELADIPIIMITSRTGDKHRNRAFELGVKRYLGKPYQEAELLENIYTVLAETSL
ncbi:MAG: response regulator, partial [Gammaproteobacteria bacterium]|nr:response regulator [Gammaproteobacteria bacterium]